MSRVVPAKQQPPPPDDEEEEEYEEIEEIEEVEEVVSAVPSKSSLSQPHPTAPPAAAPRQEPKDKLGSTTSSAHPTQSPAATTSHFSSVTPAASTAARTPAAPAAATRGHDSPAIEDGNEEGEEIEEIEEIEEVEEDEEDPEEGTEESDEGGDAEEEDMMKYNTLVVESLHEPVTAFIAREKFLYVGTESGEVQILDAANGTLVKKFNHHHDPIKDMSPDEREEHVATCCQSGVVVVQSIYDETEYYKREYSRPVNCIAIHPQYGSTEEKSFVAGSADVLQLVWKSRFLGNRRTATLVEKEGKIHAVAWKGEVVVMGCDTGVVMCSMASKKVFARFERPLSAPRAELFRCNLFWENESSIIVAWGNTVKIYKIREAKLEDRLKSREFSPQLRVEVDCGFDTDVGKAPYKICGIAPYPKDCLLVLSCLVAYENQVNELQVRIVARKTGKGMSCEEIRGRGGKMALSFTLAHHEPPTPAELHFFIVSPDVVIRAVPCDEDDHVDYLLKIHKYEEAFKYTRSRHLNRHDVEGVGKTLLDHLITHDHYEDAASHFRDVLGTSDADAKKWEDWICLFEKRGQAEALLPQMPRMENGIINGPRIKKEFYELLLNHCLECNLGLFKDYIQKLKPLYSYGALSNVVSSKYVKARQGKSVAARLDEQSLLLLGECYGLLLEFQDRNEEALEILMDVKGGNELFEFIERHHLYEKAAKTLDKLFVKNKERTIAMLLHHHRSDDETELDPLSPEAVVRKLEDSNRELLWQYLKAVREDDEKEFLALAKKNAQLFMNLIADFEPSGLLDYLKINCSSLDLRKTHDLLKMRGFLDEWVFIMARMGYRDEGLKVIVNDMKNVKKAIEFIQEFKTSEEQEELFKCLVDLVNKAEGGGGAKHHEHKVTETDTWASVARRYGVNEEEIRIVNNLGQAPNAPLPPVIRIPINMLGSLLAAIADPSIGDTVAMDPIYLIKHIPTDQQIPNLANSLSRIANSKNSHKSLMETLLRVLNGDNSDLQRNLERGRACAVRIDDTMRTCMYCHEEIEGANFVVFGAKTSYHANCVVQYLSDRGALKGCEADALTHMDEFFRRPLSILKQRPRKPVPYCILNPPGDDVETQ